MPVPRIYGHRGASGERPENTRVSFSYALATGATALETDAHITRDGVAVLSHDPTGARTCGVPLAFAQSLWSDVATWDAGCGFVDPVGFQSFAKQGIHPMTLEQLLTETHVPVNVDVKPDSPAATDIVIELIRKLGAEDRVRIASFHPGNLRRARALSYQGGLSLSVRQVLALFALPASALKRFLVPGDAAQIPTRAGPLHLDTARFIDRAHSLGLRVDYWVIDDPATAKQLASLGADGIMTDYPSRIANALKRYP